LAMIGSYFVPYFMIQAAKWNQEIKSIKKKVCVNSF
jgi:hypothetical protein